MTTMRAHTTVSSPAGPEQDYYAWLLQQARVLRSMRPVFLDWEHLAEELEAISRSEERNLGSLLEVLLKHLLKWEHQPKKRSGSWEASINNSRDKIAELLEESPSLRPKLQSLLNKAFVRARRKAGAEMGLRQRQWERRLSATSPWSAATVRNPEFWPGRPENDANGKNS